MTTSISPPHSPSHGARSAPEPTIAPGRFSPVVDVAEDARCVTIRALLPGIGVRDVVVGFDHDRVVLRGARRARSESGGRDVRPDAECERFWHTVVVPSGVRAVGAMAELDGGVLTVTLPKGPSAEPPSQLIEIRARA